MIDAILSALGILFSWPTIAFLVAGTVIGMVFGAIPGLGGTIALALLIPITFGMNADNAIVLFGSTIGGVAFGGSISAILINVPGTGPNAATLLDGYPMSRQGRAGEALGASATASALGSLVGLVVLVLLLPFAVEIVLAFGPPEFFWLAVFGLTIIAVANRGNIIKGLISGGFGLMLSLIGYSTTTGEYRYGFGTDFLWDGVPLVVSLIGLFAVAEVLNLAASGGNTITDSGMVEMKGSVLEGVKSVFEHPTLFIRSAATGTLIGIIPGAGGTVANFISYIQAMQISNDQDFGKGNIKGVIASEAANDAKDGGALLPTVIFGIPGSAGMAVLLGGLILHGLRPGRTLLTDGLPTLFLLIFALLFSNILTSVIGLMVAGNLAKITKIPTNLLAGPILVVSFAGAFAIRNQLLDIAVAIIFGVFGFAMMVYGFSRVAIVLAIILGPIAERALQQSLMIASGNDITPTYSILFTNPISAVLICLTVLSLSLPFVRQYRQEGRAIDES